jgi:CheY-like chemotaxis protein
MDGRQVLARIKNDDSLRTIPIVILTTSESEEGRREKAITYMPIPTSANRCS